MKCVIRVFVILWIVMVVSFSIALADQPMNQTGFALLESFYDGEYNCAVSPVSLALALSMVSQGAAGDTQAQIDHLTGLTDAKTAKSLQDELCARGFKIANAIFVADDLEMKEDWLTVIKDSYDGEAFPFGTAEALDAWVKEKTNGLLEKAPAAPDESTRMALLNAVAMDMQWQFPFLPEATHEDVFHAPDGDITVPFMCQSFDWYAVYGEQDGAQLLQLDYKPVNGKSMSMFLALPEEGEMDALLQSLSKEGLGFFDCIEAVEREVILWLPKVDIKVHNELKEPLQALGMDLPFTNAADLGGIAEEPLKIGDILQDIRIQIDEEGTLAAAVTEIDLAAGEAYDPEPPILMRLDRPFVALIVDGETGTVCFAAVVMNPLGDE